MGEQRSIICNPLESDGGTVPLYVSSHMVKWETNVPKCVILCDHMGERHSIIIPLWSDVLSFTIQWESSGPKCVILDDQMGEQYSIICNPLESDRRTVSRGVSSCAVQWESGVPKYSSFMIKWENSVS